MTPAALLAGVERAAEAASRAETYEAAKRRIDTIEAHQGHAATPGTTAPPPSKVGSSAASLVKAPGLLEDIPFIGPAVSGAKSALGLAEGAAGLAGTSVGSAASTAAEPLAEGLVDLVKPIALKLTLYAVLILGGIALAGYGLATALRPEPPKLRHLAGKAAMAAAA